ncbi:MAG: hypothetical protein KGO49_11360 [Gammaproteobacteria bacterium]|nr:hypothetical protein [Gammaproteobacteria bacterium]
MSEQNKKPYFRSREDTIAVIEQQVRWWRSPRLTMASLVLIAGMMAFIMSALLLKFGVMSMAIRYACGLLVGYLTLCVSLWIWTGSHPTNIATDIESIQSSEQSKKTSNFDWSDLFGFDSDEATFVIAIVIGLFAAVFWFISSAPTMMAELTLDSLVSLQVYHRMRRADAQPYLYTFWRRTRFSLFFVAFVFVGGGWLLQHLAPEAHTLGDAIRIMMHS